MISTIPGGSDIDVYMSPYKHTHTCINVQPEAIRFRFIKCLIITVLDTDSWISWVDEYDWSWWRWVDE